MDRKVEIKLMIEAHARAQKSAAKMLASPKVQAALKAGQAKARLAREKCPVGPTSPIPKASPSPHSE